ncbi:MAG: DUF2442 domain-containing protein [Spirochaetaceae bacterium]
MSSSMIEIQVADAVDVRATDDKLVVELEDGRVISLPLSWYPRLLHGSPEERNNYQLIGGGSGIHWPDLDEDLSVEELLAGHRSQESQSSLQQWLDKRKPNG